MNCQEFETRLEAAIENRDDEALVLLARHAAVCSSAGCRTLWADHLRLEQAIVAWKCPPVPAELSDRVLAELRRPLLAAGALTACEVALVERPGDRPINWRRRAIVASIATAGAMLLMLSLSGRNDETSLVRGERMTDGDGSALAGTDDPVDGGEADSAAREADALREVGVHYVVLARKTTGFASDLAMLVVPESEPTATEADDPEPGWIDSIGERIEPVKSGVSGKLGEWFGHPAT
ncbi:MAG: hypothetical protein R3B90_02785 [Planctomycetaceae bacterium]